MGGDLQVKANTALNGTLVVSDNKATTLGGTALVKQGATLNSTLVVKGVTTVHTHVQPNADGGANLGSSSKRFANVYTQDMHFSNEGTEGNSIDGTTGNWTLQEGHDYLYFINNKTGVKFRVVMEKV